MEFSTDVNSFEVSNVKSFPGENSVKNNEKIMVASMYAALILTVLSFSSVAIYNLRRHPSRYTFWFISERSRKHALAGFMLTFGFLLLMAFRNLIEPTAAIIGSLLYAFVVVPISTGLISLQIIREIVLLALMWVLHSTLTLMSIFVFVVYAVFKWAPALYGSCPRLQKCLMQILFFYASKNLLCTTSSSDSLLHIQIFAFFKFMEYLRSIIFDDCRHPDKEGSGERVLPQCCVSLISATWILLFIGGTFCLSYLPLVTLEYFLCCAAYFMMTNIEIVPNSPDSHTLIKFVKFFHIWQLCELEFLVVPILVDVLHLSMSVAVLIYNGVTFSSLFIFIFNVYQPWLVLQNTWLHWYQLELDYLKRMPLPKREDLMKLADGQTDGHAPCCPICFDEMIVCRKTCCGHLFHWSCFRRCHLVSSHCPICRTEIHL